MKNKKYHTVQNPKEKSKQEAKLIPLVHTHIHINDSSLSWLGTATTLKSSGLKLYWWTKAFPFSEILLSCKCFLQGSKML